MYLRDEIAESLAKHAERLPEARELLAALDGRGPEAARPPSPGAATSRLAVRGLTGSARGFLASWLQRATGRTVLYLVAHGEGFEEARDDVEYFRGAAQTLAFPEPDNLPYDPSSPHTGITAQRLETLVPWAGHLVHMPAHIYLQLGDYAAAARSNEAAVAADRAYIERTGAQGVYPIMYYSHNLHFLSDAYAMEGRFSDAHRAAEQLVANVQPAVRDMPMGEFVMGAPMLVDLRFARWTEVLAAPAERGSAEVVGYGRGGGTRVVRERAAEGAGRRGLWRHRTQQGARGARPRVPDPRRTDRPEQGRPHDRRRAAPGGRGGGGWARVRRAAHLVLPGSRVARCDTPLEEAVRGSRGGLPGRFAA